ncbi:MAG TPA: DUF1566 domain-containing protein [Candidatus Binatia bacterium]|jgi:hypothetical protein
MRRITGSPSPASVLLACWTLAFAPAVPALAADAVCGDVNASGSVTASDALAVLKDSVGQPIELRCPPDGTPLQTGQTFCYDSVGKFVSCAGTGQDAEFQHGIAHSFTDNGNGTISDGATGLMWEKLSSDGSIHDVGATYTWAAAFSSKIAALNSAGFAGHHDWRLPNLAEMESIDDVGTVNPSAWPPFDSNCVAGCSIHTCSCTAVNEYWTSSTYINDRSGAWFVHFNDGYAGAFPKTGSQSVRAVRTGN